MLTFEQKQHIIAECNKYIAIANNYFKINPVLVSPIVNFTLKGTTAGTASFKEWTVNFNSQLITNNWNDFLARTIPHEIAHLVDFYMNMLTGMRTAGKRRSLHGKSWKKIMRIFGVKDITRCHNYNTDNVKKNNTRKFRYYCDCIEPKVVVGLEIHTRIQKGFNLRTGRMVSYNCPICHVKFNYASKFSELNPNFKGNI